MQMWPSICPGCQCVKKVTEPRRPVPFAAHGVKTAWLT